MAGRGPEISPAGLCSHRSVLGAEAFGEPRHAGRDPAADPRRSPPDTQDRPVSYGVLGTGVKNWTANVLARPWASEPARSGRCRMHAMACDMGRKDHRLVGLSKPASPRRFMAVRDPTIRSGRTGGSSSKVSRLRAFAWPGGGWIGPSA